MGKLDRGRLEALLARFAQVRLLVLGDLFLDEYLFGEVDRKAHRGRFPFCQFLGMGRAS